jgi:hypothetical protein
MRKGHADLAPHLRNGLRDQPPTSHFSATYRVSILDAVPRSKRTDIAGWMKECAQLQYEQLPGAYAQSDHVEMLGAASGRRKSGALRRQAVGGRDAAR